MNNLPLVTIGLLTYNNSDAISETLESLVSQTYADKELVIYDDCSTDNTYEILEKFAQKFAFVKIFRNEKNIGVFENFKQLFVNLKGGYFFWACPDDRYEHSMICDLVDKIWPSSYSVAVLSSTKIEYYHDAREKYICYFQDIDSKRYHSDKKVILDSVLFRKNHEQYCLYIHSLISVSFIKESRVFKNKSRFTIEELFPMFFILSGGILTVPDVRCAKVQSLISLKERNPDAYRIAYGLKNKIVCLASWSQYLFSSFLPIKKRYEWAKILLKILYKITIWQFFYNLLSCLLKFKNKFLMRCILQKGKR